MTISKNSVVSINYTLKNDEGVVLDTSENRDPLSYIQGMGMMLPVLEDALEGKSKGDSLSLKVSPEEGYGVYDEALIYSVPKNQFHDASELEEGTQVQVKDETGDVKILTVTAIEEDGITLDGNHPLAGENLHFDLSVTEVREATPEELDHGHVH